MIDDVFVGKLFSADKQSAARAISIVEKQDGSSLDLLDITHKRLGHAYRVGITGPPGVGKSTIVSKLARALNGKKRKLG